MRYLIGIGNYMGLDDSVGLRVAETIAEECLDRDFDVIDLGGNLLDLIHYLRPDVESVLIVDSARMGVSPGEFAFFTPKQVSSGKALADFSTHEGDLLEVLGLAGSLYPRLPEITVLGIEPQTLRLECGLSAQLENRLLEYVEAAAEFFASSRTAHMSPQSPI